MSNMSYCRFQNTVLDMEDCISVLNDSEELSDDEANAKDRLIQLCVDVACEHGKCTVL
jgi:hypothetical protein